MAENKIKENRRLERDQIGPGKSHRFLHAFLAVQQVEFGVIDFSGVAVNDSLIMIDLINRERSSGVGLTQVLHDCVTRRFRPIMLTTLTTFCSLLPMITEKSLQARFLIPMAISLVFRVIFATCITLILVPSLYMILEDIKARIFWANSA
jgi:multidrug efflux pump subunit AcrB